MATRLQQIYTIDATLRKMQDDIKALNKARQDILDGVLKDGTIEDRGFALVAEKVSGKRFLDVKKMGELYPFELQAAGKMTCTLSDASKVLSGEEIEQVCGRYDDKFVFHVEKKANNIVEVL
jgi:hypothetical protein